MWNDHVVMLAGDSLIFCLRCGKWARRVLRHLRTAWRTGTPTPSTATRYRSLCSGRHPMPPHSFVGDVQPLQFEAWSRWGRQAGIVTAIEMTAAQVSPLIVEQVGLAALEVASDSEAEVEAPTELLVLD